MKWIVGLGNPEKKYENTRHNAGFAVIDVLSETYHIPLTQARHRSLVGQGRMEGERVMLMKPLTYMNRSGEALRELADYYKLEDYRDLIVLSDDITLAVGRLRIRLRGSSGGHNGLKDIIARLDSQDFTRIRIGVGQKPPGADLADWVLGHFDREDGVLMKAVYAKAAEATVALFHGDPDRVLSDYNGYDAGRGKLCDH